MLEWHCAQRSPGHLQREVNCQTTEAQSWTWFWNDLRPERKPRQHRIGNHLLKLQNHPRRGWTRLVCKERLSQKQTLD